MEKRKEFLREHGVEPGFLTGTWMERFGTVEGDEAREKMVREERERQVVEGLVGMDEVSTSSVTRGVPAASVPGKGAAPLTGVRGSLPRSVMDASTDEPPPRQEKKPLKMWLGIW